jgi:hypothetical protein
MCQPNTSSLVLPVLQGRRTLDLDSYSLEHFSKYCSLHKKSLLKTKFHSDLPEPVEGLHGTMPERQAFMVRHAHHEQPVLPIDMRLPNKDKCSSNIWSLVRQTSLVCGFCSSGQCVSMGFLQTLPHGFAPLPFSYCFPLPGILRIFTFKCVRPAGRT